MDYKDDAELRQLGAALLPSMLEYLCPIPDVTFEEGALRYSHSDVLDELDQPTDETRGRWRRELIAVMLRLAGGRRPDSDRSWLEAREQILRDAIAGRGADARRAIARSRGFELAA